MSTSRWRSAAKSPSFVPPGNRSGESRQLWIARHRPSLASRSATGAPNSATNPLMPGSRHALGGGPGLAWNATRSCAPWCWIAWPAAGRPNRSPGGSPAGAPSPLSRTRASTASSTPRSAVPTTAVGVTTCHAPSSSAADAAAREARPRASSKTGSRSPSGQRSPSTGVPARQAARQSRSTDRRATACLARTPARHAAPDHHLRQWHRVRPPPSAQNPARRPHLLLRYPQPLAEGRHRKRDRSHARPLAPQNRPGNHRRRYPQRLRRRLQPHPQKMPRLPDPRRGLPFSTVALQM